MQRTHAAGPAYLVKDMQPPGAPVRPADLTDVNGTLFLVALRRVLAADDVDVEQDVEQRSALVVPL